MANPNAVPTTTQAGRRTGSLLVFAPRERIMSIHDGAWIADARAGALARTLLPWRTFPGVRTYHAFDVVVTGGNPLLAAILAARASARGLDVAVTLPDGDDGWPYDLACSRRGGALVSSALGLDPGRPFTGMSAAADAVGSLLAGSATLLPCRSLSLSRKHPRGEVTLYPGCDGGRRPLPSGPYGELASAFLRATRGLAQARVVGARGRTAVFARLLVLTSRPDSFSGTSVSQGDYGALIRWDHPLVAATGTAATDPSGGRDAAHSMIGDIMSCSRGDPLRDLRPE